MRYDPRVRVQFQEKAWCDAKVMQEWMKMQWEKACDGDMLLVLDVHKAQKTENIISLFQSLNTTFFFVPAGTTSLVQPLDVCINGSFKSAVSRLANQHVTDNLKDYMHGSISASERRVLFTKWVGQAWEEVSSNREATVRSFKKCGISVPVDGSGDGDISIRGLEDYTVEVDDEEEEFVGEDDDPFTDM